MKKLLFFLVLFAAGGFATYTFLLTPEKRACAKLVDLCGGSNSDPKAFGQCQDFMAEVKKSSPDSADTLARCITESNSCSAAVGCHAGALMTLGLDAGKSFLEGLGRSLAGGKQDR